MLWPLAIWAARLSFYITVRSIGKGEDRRYQAIRARNEPHFAWKSLYLVFWLQALLAWIVSLPLLGAFASIAPLGILDYLGLALWLAGFVFEAGGDWQLARFKTKPGQCRCRHATAACGATRATLTTLASSASGGGSGCMALSAGAWWSPARPGAHDRPAAAGFRGHACWKRTSAIVGRNMPTTS